MEPVSYTHLKTIISKPRSGYYVAPKRILQSIRNFSLHSEEYSGQLTYELYDFKKIEADNYLASEMLLPEKSKIYKIVWLYSDGTQPVSYTHLTLFTTSRS